MNKKVLFFDSGIGGLTTLATTLKLCPTLHYLYVADTKHAPYGRLTNKQVIKYTKLSIQPYVNSGDIGAIVLACNTATNCAIEELRKAFPTIPIIGTEPAVLPAVNSVKHGTILVLATPTTIMQPKFELITSNYKDQLIICPMPNLATEIEEYISSGSTKAKENIIHSLQVLHNNHPNISGIVLGCTHYSIIKDKCQNIFKVPCFDGNLGVANQLLRTIENKPEFQKPSKTFPMLITTSVTKTNYNKVLSKLLSKI